MEPVLLTGRISQSMVGMQTRETLCAGSWVLTTGSLCPVSLACVQDLGPMSQGAAAQVVWMGLHS